MSRFHGGAVIGVALVMALTGCGGSDSSTSAGGASSASSTTSPTSVVSSSEPTPSETPATVQQYASIVARNGDITKQLKKMDSCDWLGNGSLDSDPASLTCLIGLLTMSYQAKTLALSLSSASDDSAPAYIGPPPDELAALVDETTAKAQTLGQVAAKADHQRCADSAAGPCGQLRGDTWQAMNDLTRALQAWSPYL